MTVERFVELDARGVTLCIQRGGVARPSETLPIVVLNGTGSDLRNRPSPLEWPLAERFEVIALDHRGLGRSEQHDVSYQPDMSDFARDVIAVCDELGLAEFDLLGVSFGGMVAQEVAIRAGDRVSALVLCCTSSGGAGGSSYPLHELYAGGGGPLDILDRWDTRAASNPAIESQLRAIFEAGAGLAEPPAGLLSQIEARRGHDTWDRLSEITADTLVAYGIYDGVAPPENSVALAKSIRNAEVASFDGGHLFLWQDRSAWPHIVDFLSD